MEKYCLIFIGDDDCTVEKVFLDIFTSPPLLKHVPFITSGKEGEWRRWESEGNKALSGIGEGAAGCLIAHRRAWEFLQSTNFEYALILESDAKLTRHGNKYLGNFLAKLSSLNFNLIHLGTHEKNKLIPNWKNIFSWSVKNIIQEIYERICLNYSVPVLATRKFPFSTHAYVITHKAACELLELTPDFHIPIDVMLNAYSQVKANRIATVRKPLVVQDEASESATKKFGR